MVTDRFQSVDVVPLPGGLCGRVKELCDEMLMSRYRDGEKAAFVELFSRYSGRLFGWFLRSTSSESIAHDLVQHTFLNFHRARNDFKTGAKVRPWLFAIGANVRRDHFRRVGRKREQSLETAKHVEPSVPPEASTCTDRLVRRALDALPEHQREVLLLHWYEELSFAEVGQVLGVSRSAVKVRAHRAYGRLRQMLGEGVPQLPKSSS
jgi:RNA polymerase sigma factor (sigma-70 family)